MVTVSEFEEINIVVLFIVFEFFEESQIWESFCQLILIFNFENIFFFVHSSSADYFPDRSKLRGGVYFVEFVPKTHSGKPIRSQITDLATEMFKAAKENDSDIQSYISDFPREFRKLIQAI